MIHVNLESGHCQCECHGLGFRVPRFPFRVPGTSDNRDWRQSKQRTDRFASVFGRPLQQALRGAGMAMATPRTPRRPYLPAPSHNRVPRRRTSSARVGSSKGTTRVRPERRGFVQRLRETPGRTGLADGRYGQAMSGTAGNTQLTETTEGFTSAADGSSSPPPRRRRRRRRRT